MKSHLNRRSFLQSSAAAVAATSFGGMTLADSIVGQAPLFEISLAQWSLHKTLFGNKMDHLDFAKVTKEQFGISAVEYVNQFFKDKAEDAAYLAEMNKRANDLGVKQLLIMIDGEGNLGDANLHKRTEAVKRHFKWVDAGKTLGCHSIRVNAASSGSYEDQVHRAADGLRALSEYAKEAGLNVIVENHGGLSSNGQWLAATIEKVGMDNCGTLPDFGNFNIGGGQFYDRYQGIQELMPFAKGVSAKSHDFDDDGNEIHTDYLKMVKIVLDAGYRGFIGIEYEGGKIGESEGILATKKLLERVREQVAGDYK
ncbi:MAG: TIM barrel protein [Planctomycetaceae bacterium]|nr:TIM barrel protein [Planctomycetaceae bacterium]